MRGRRLWPAEAWKKSPSVGQDHYAKHESGNRERKAEGRPYKFGVEYLCARARHKAVKHIREKSTPVLLREKMPLQWRNEIHKVVDVKELNIHLHIGLGMSLHLGRLEWSRRSSTI